MIVLFIMWMVMVILMSMDVSLMMMVVSGDVSLLLIVPLYSKAPSRDPVSLSALKCAGGKVYPKRSQGTLENIFWDSQIPEC
jgi:hypothetical protein